MNQSSHLFKLPPEIRTIIYQYHLGGNAFHFVRTSGDPPRMLHCLCPFQGRRSHLLTRRNGLTYCLHVCRDDGQGEEYPEVQEQQSQSTRLSLLLACRQIYSETKTLLAQSNVFNVQAHVPEKFQAVAGLRDLLPQQSFHAIRALEISFCGSNVVPQTTNLDDGSFFNHWVEMCATVRDMQGLLSLHIWLYIEQDGPAGTVLTAGQEENILGALVGDEWSRLRHFQVEVSWPATAGSARLVQKAPFTLVRGTPESPWVVPHGLKMVNLA